LDHEEGLAKSVPHCPKCGQPVRPNVNLKNDIQWIEDRAQLQDKNFAKWFQPLKFRSLTILEIGCGPSQPIARSIADDLLKSDKYRCALVRINPVRERTSQYQWEKKELAQLLSDHTDPHTREISDFEVPDLVFKDHSALVREEEKQLNALQN